VTAGMKDQTTLAEELLQRIGRTVGDRASVSTVFGDAIEREGITVIPVARARFAFGGGGGGAYDPEGGSGGGGGGGAAVSPVGYIEVRAGAAEFRRISTPADLVLVVAAGSLAAMALKRLLGG
jgi:uncharacterized spore protein YtfJ